MFSVSRKVAIVTGSSRGIGKAIALGLAQEGASVVLASRSKEDLEKVSAEIRGLGGKSIYCTVDISEEKDVRKLVRRALDEFGSVDILVNNAGISPIVRRPEATTKKDWESILSTNLIGGFLCASEAGKTMIEARKGSIVNIASVSSVIALPGLVAYSASKAGIILMTKELALDWARYNIRVNAVAPGFIETDMNKLIRKSRGKFYDYFISRTPMKRFGKPEEVVGAVIFLSSDEASFITGQTLFVDGGLLAT